MEFTDACNGYRKSTLRIVDSDAKGTRTSTQQPGTWVAGVDVVDVVDTVDTVDRVDIVL